MRLVQSWALAIFVVLMQLSMGLIFSQNANSTNPVSSVFTGEFAHAQTPPPLGEEPPETTSPNTNAKPLVEEPGSNTPQNKEDAKEQAKDNYETCTEQNGKLAFMMCPILDNVANMMSDAVTDIMHQFLEVEPLKFEGPIYETWNAVKAIANIAFVIIFLVMIFSYLIPVNTDSYNFKNILPKLVAAAIFVQASYLVSALIVDMGNILGQGVGTLVNAVAGGGSTPDSFNSGIIIENVATVFGIATLSVLLFLAAPLAIPIALMVVVSVAAFIFTLAMRYFLIGMFIVISPLAFAAWVLPNTEKYFSQWLKSFVKISLMYPIIIGLLAIAANVGSLIPLTADSAGAGGSVSQNIATSLIKILIFVAAFAAVTQSFRWAGGFMNAAGTAINDIGKKGRGKIKDSQMYEDAKNKTKSRQLKRVNKVGDKLSGLTGSNNKAVSAAGKGMYHAGTLVLAGHSGSSLAKQRDSSKLVKTYADQLDDMKEADMMNQRRALMKYYGDPAQSAKAKSELIQNGGESLLGFTTSFEGRQAMVRRLAKDNLVGPELGNAIHGFGHPEDYQMMIKENGKNMSDSPGQFARYDRSDPSSTNPLTGNPVVMGDVNPGIAKSMLSGLTPFKVAGKDFKVDTIAVAADNTAKSTPTAVRASKQWARVLGEYLPYSVEDNFDPTDKRNFMGADKRATLLKVMARNQAEFTSTPEGQKKYGEILHMVQSNKPDHQDAIHLLEQEDDWAHIKATLGL